VKSVTPRRLGALVSLAGVVNVASAITPAVHRRLSVAEHALTPDVARLAAGATALVGLVLILIGRGLAQRRRVAQRIAVVLLLASALFHLAKGLDVEEASLAAALAGILVWKHRLFAVPPEPARLRRLVRAVPMVAGLELAYGLSGFLARRRLVEPRPTLGLALRETVARLAGFPGWLRVGGRFGQWFPASLTVLGILSLGALMVFTLAPLAAPSGEERLRSLVLRLSGRDDGDTLDPFALRADKAYVLSDDGEAAVAYRCVNGVGLASGDPVGCPASAAGALGRFLDLCDRRGWRPAVLGARADRLDIYHRAGLRPLYLGDEAVVEVCDFSLQGRSMRPVRQAVSRTQNFGVTTEIRRDGELDPTLRRALLGIAERWRGAAPERGFSMALDGLLSGRDPDSLIVICRDARGAPIAFQRYVPCRGGRGLSLDAMRRDRESPNGVNERMIVDVVDYASTHGVEEVSLNFAAFRAIIDDDADLGPVEAAEAWLVRRLNPFFQIESLYRFNAKFRPRWVRRYLLYRSPADLLPITVAALSAEAFLPFDRHRPDPDRAPALARP
jgi:lysyl-tRNA synthetase, class II